MAEVHLLHPMTTACGGAEWRTLSLFEVLADYCPVTVWALNPPDRRLFGRYPIKVVDFPRGLFPRSGTFVFVGAYFELPEWISKTSRDRAILVYNTDLPDHLRLTVSKLLSFGFKKVEVVTASDALRKHLNGLDVVYVGTEPSWIDIERFSIPAKKPAGPFSIGRFNRDRREKFHEDDPVFYRRLAEEGFQLRVMGGTCLKTELPKHPNIEILPEGTEPPEVFLRSLDAMIYRTSDQWFEAFGRVIFEGMATGVVPVAHERGGYAEFIDHGADGVLYRTDAEAIEWLQRLRSEPGLKEAMGAAARKKVEALYSPEAKERLVRYYLGD